MNRRDSYLISSRALGQRRVCDVFYSRGLRQDRHRHDSAAVSFVVSGRYQETIASRSDSRNAATLIYHPAGEYHAVEFESDVRIISVEFRGETTADCLDNSSSHRSELVGWLGSRLQFELTRVDSASSLAIEGIIDEILVEGSRRKVLSEERGRSLWLTRSIEFLHDNFSSALTLDEIAEVAGVHSAHLSRVFRQKMGCTVGEYVRRLRFEFASQQLLSTERSLCEVAHEAGFADQSHFHRQFRTKMGVTPYAYRKLHGR